MKTIEQRTPEWLALRKNHIGSSDAAVIMGVCPFKLQDGRVKTPRILWEEKLGLLDTSVDSANIRFGREMEEKILKWYSEAKEVLVTPSVEFHPSVSFIMASIDGINRDKKIVLEIKCANKEDHLEASLGKVPQKYIPQCQHILSVVYELYGIEQLHYISFNNDSYHVVIVQIDHEYIKRMYEKYNEFWSYIVNLQEPPLSELDYVEQDEQWLELAKEIWSLKEQKKYVEDRLKALEPELQVRSKNHLSKAGDFRYIPVSRKGSIDYSSIPEIKKMDLEPFRKPSSTYWKLNKVSHG